MHTCIFNSGLRGELMQRTHTVQKLNANYEKYQVPSSLEPVTFCSAQTKGRRLVCISHDLLQK